MKGVLLNRKNAHRNACTGKELKETGDFIYGNYEIIEHVLSKAKYVGIQNLENPENNKELRRYETKITDKRKRNRNRGLDARYYSSLVIR